MTNDNHTGEKIFYTVTSYYEEYKQDFKYFPDGQLWINKDNADINTPAHYYTYEQAFKHVLHYLQNIVNSVNAEFEHGDFTAFYDGELIKIEKASSENLKQYGF
jgi:hypothetical protein